MTMIETPSYGIVIGQTGTIAHALEGCEKKDFDACSLVCAGRREDFGNEAGCKQGAESENHLNPSILVFRHLPGRIRLAWHLIQWNYSPIGRRPTINSVARRESPNCWNT